MLSKNPLELINPGEKLDKSELEEAVRLGIIAELDAINLYMQLADAIEDEKVRSVFLDIAKEEKTHVGEFLSLLETLDPDQASELKAGFQEVYELTGYKPSDPPGKEEKSEGGLDGVFTADEWETIISEFNGKLGSLRTLRGHLPTTIMGEGVEYVTLIDYNTGGTKPKKLCEISFTFKIPQKLLDLARRNKEMPGLDIFLDKAVELANMENKIILEGCTGSPGLITTEGILVKEVTSWDTPGSAVEEVAQAIAEFGKKGIAPPYKLFLGPERYAKLLKIHEKAGVMELERIRRLVTEVVVVNNMPGDKALLVAASPNYLDIVVGRDATIDYIGPEDGMHTFRVWETLTPRIKRPEAIILLVEKH
jgi:uncharacterized linocin/CFP29 family protein